MWTVYIGKSEKNLATGIVLLPIKVCATDILFYTFHWFIMDNHELFENVSDIWHHYLKHKKKIMLLLDSLNTAQGKNEW